MMTPGVQRPHGVEEQGHPQPAPPRVLTHSLSHYTQTWINRRSRRAFLSGDEAKSSYYYRASWERFCKAWEDEAERLFGTPSILPIMTLTLTFTPMEQAHGFSGSPDAPD